MHGAFKTNVIQVRGMGGIGEIIVEEIERDREGEREREGERGRERERERERETDR